MAVACAGGGGGSGGVRRGLSTSGRDNAARSPYPPDNEVSATYISAAASAVTLDGAREIRLSPPRPPDARARTHPAHSCAHALALALTRGTRTLTIDLAGHSFIYPRTHAYTRFTHTRTHAHALTDTLTHTHTACELGGEKKRGREGRERQEQRLSYSHSFSQMHFNKGHEKQLSQKVHTRKR